MSSYRNFLAKLKKFYLECIPISNVIDKVFLCIAIFLSRYCDNAMMIIAMRTGTPQVFYIPSNFVSFSDNAHAKLPIIRHIAFITESGHTNRMQLNMYTVHTCTLINSLNAMKTGLSNRDTQIRFIKYMYVQCTCFNCILLYGLIRL